MKFEAYNRHIHACHPGGMPPGKISGLKHSGMGLSIIFTVLLQVN